MKRILLVDDEALILSHTRDMIDWGAIGCIIVGTARDGREGLARMRDIKPDIVITDVVMPGMDGLEMIEKARSSYFGKFIVISGYQEFEYAHKAIHMGAIDYLLKPFSPEELRVAVLNCMGKGVTVQQDYETLYGSQVARLLRAVDEHLGEPELTLSWLCENELFMNETYMGRLMQKRTGMKFTAWVTERRLSEARRLLKNDRDISISDVAGRVGFSSPQYFIEVFKKHMGVSPGQYRKGPEG